MVAPVVVRHGCWCVLLVSTRAYFIGASKSSDVCEASGERARELGARHVLIIE